MKLISVVTPCFNEEKSINICHKRIKSIFKEWVLALDFKSHSCLSFFVHMWGCIKSKPQGICCDDNNTRLLAESLSHMSSYEETKIQKDVQIKPAFN